MLHNFSGWILDPTVSMMETMTVAVIYTGSLRGRLGSGGSARLPPPPPLPPPPGGAPTLQSRRCRRGQPGGPAVRAPVRRRREGDGTDLVTADPGPSSLPGSAAAPAARSAPRSCRQKAAVPPPCSSAGHCLACR